MISAFSALGHDFVQETPHVAYTIHRCDNPECEHGQNDVDFFLMATTDPHFNTNGGTTAGGLFYIGSMESADATPRAISLFAAHVENHELELRLVISILKQQPIELIREAIQRVLEGELDIELAKINNPALTDGFKTIFGKKDPREIPPT